MDDLFIYYLLLSVAFILAFLCKVTAIAVMINCDTHNYRSRYLWFMLTIVSRSMEFELIAACVDFV